MRIFAIENAKKRGLQPEKSGENSASAHEKSLIFYFIEKASMENHFGFCDLKSPQNRMNTNINGPIIYYDRPRCFW